MRIGTAEENSTFLSQGQAIQALCQETGYVEPVEVVVSPFASTQNASRLAKGEIEFGFMASNWIGRALRAEAPFTEKIALRMVAPMNVGPLFFITRADSALKNVRDMKGKRVSVGLAQSGMTQHAHVIFGVLGMSFDDFEPHHLDFQHGGEALGQGKVDAQFQCPIPNRIMADLDSKLDLRVLEHDAADLDKILGAVSFYRRATMKAGSLSALKADSQQPGVVNVLVSHDGVPAETVAKLTETIVNGADRLGELNALFEGLRALFDPLKSEGAKSLEFGGVPLHEGAVAAYRKLGLLS
ncbi:MAG: hypothetical protein RLZ98_1693 [Pseudomonadota bacterium]|jgi:TRAP transporter TAXI family solute receptor